MTIDRLFNLLSQFVFLAVALITLVRWAGHRDQARRDIALVFVVLAVAILAQYGQDLFPRAAPFLTVLFFAGLLAHPYLLLRVVAYFRPVPTLVQRTVLAGLILVFASFLLAETAQVFVFLFAVVYFIVAQLYCARLLIREARAITGILSRRLRLASIGAGLLALVFLSTLGLVFFFLITERSPAGQSVIAALIQFIGILSGLSYYLGFAPPRWLRRLWQLHELDRFLQKTSKRLALDQPGIFEELSTAALRSMDGVTTVIAACDVKGDHLTIEIPGDPPMQVENLEHMPGAIGSSWRERKARVANVPDDTGQQVTEWAEGFGARALLIVPILSALRPWGLLIIASRYAPLFEQDDLDLLKLFVEQSASSLDYAALIEETKQAGEEQYHRVLDNMLEGGQIISPEWRYLYMNDAAARQGRQKPEHFLGRTMMEVYPGIEESELFKVMQSCMHERTPHHMENEFVYPDGSRSWFELSMQPVPEGIFILSNDISERKLVEAKLREGEEHFRAMADSAPVMIRVSGPDKLCTWFNQQWLEFTGCTMEQQLGNGWAEGVHPDDFERCLDTYNSAFDSRKQFEMEYRLRRYDKEYRWIVDIGVPRHSPEGAFIGYIGSCLDITDRKQAEARSRLAIESAPNAIVIINDKGWVVLVNAKAEEYFGYSRAEMLGKTVEILVPNRFRSQHPAFRASFLAEPQARPMGIGRDLFALRKDGSEFPVEIGLAPIEATEGTLVMATIVDITERKQAEIAVRESEERYRIVSGLTSDYAYKDRVEPDGSITPEWITESFTRITGYSLADTFAPDFWMNVIHPDDTPTLLRHMEQIFAGHADTAEFRVRTKAGDMRWFRDFANPTWDASAGRVVSFYGAVQDLTEHKQAEDRRLQIQERFEKIFNNSPMSMALSSVKDGTYLEVNQAFLDLMGYSREEVIGRTSLDLNLIHPEDRARILNELRSGTFRTAETPIHPKSGEVKQIRIYAQEIAIGADRYFLSMNEDITERKRAEEEIRRLNEELEQRVADRTAELSKANSLLNAMMDYVPDHIFFKDRKSRFIRNSRSQASMMGLNDPAESVGKTDFDFFPHAQQAFDQEQKIMHSGEPIIDLEEHVVWPDGRETWVSTTKVPLRQPGGEIIGIFGIARDITDRKRTEESLRKAKVQLEVANKELESFSYSVSHDLRAPLRAIDGYSRMLMEDYEPLLDAEGKRLFDVVRSEAQRMGQLIDDLLAFSRLGRAEMKFIAMDMRSMAQTIFNELTTPEARERIDFQLGEVQAAWGDPSLIRQVWVNLLANAIKFSSAKERAVIQVQGEQQQDEIIYHVRDNGAGFDMKYASKLFGVFQRLHSEREFEGTGVGLAIIQRVISRHGGRVWAEGEPGRGATFSFSLPRKGDRS